jgi:hypothetical protein
VAALFAKPRLRRALIVLLAALAGSAALPSTSHAAAVGVNVTATSGDPLRSPQVASLLTAIRPAWVRVFMGWNGLEPSQGVFNTAEIASYHAFFSHLPAGTKVDVDIVGTPRWANGGASAATPPSSAATFGSFVNYLANAFRGQVTAWEIWNEEDSTSFWSGTTAQYVSLLAAASSAVKAADPSAQVVLGPLVGNDAPYLESIYAAGGGPSFDAVAVHADSACNVTSPQSFALNPGTRTVGRWYFLGVQSVEATLLAHGDGSRPLYMTEFGWASTSSTCDDGASTGTRAGGVDQATQALYLQQAYHCLAQPQYSYVKAADWFELYDAGSGGGWLDNLGLVSSSFAAKPALAAIEAAARGSDPVSGACGPAAASASVTQAASKTVKPAISVLSPSSRVVYRRGPLVVRVRASVRLSAITKITLFADGRRIVTFKGFRSTLSSGSWRWYGARRLTLGRHTLTFVASSKAGRSAKSTVTLDRVR